MPSVAQIIRRRRNREQRQAQARQRDRLWTGFIVGSALVIIIGPMVAILTFLSFLYWRASSQMPQRIDTIYLDPIIDDTRFYDASDAVRIYAVQDPLGDEREWISLEALPPYVVEATLQIEDPDFLERGAFDAWQLLSRLWSYGVYGVYRPDHSLAGRLADHTLVPNARQSDVDRDLLQMVFSADVMRLYTPRRVLEWYLNTAYYGNDAYGIDAAAQVYFGKRATALQLDEAALLAAIPLAPQYNPLDDAQAARDRQLDLLRTMRAAGIISDEDFDRAASIEPTVRTDLAQAPFIAPEFALYARKQAEAILDSLGMNGGRLISRGSLRITTTLDLDLYYQAECILRAHLEQLRGQNPDTVQTLAAQPCVGTDYLSDTINVNPTALPDTGALVIHDVQTGEIRAIVGDVTAYNRQPGPTLYPFVYLTGFLSGNFTAAQMVFDIPSQFPGPTEGSIYAPLNPDGLYRGPLNLRDAMAAGLRVPAVAVANREGLSRILRTSRTLGLNNLADNNLFDLALIDRGGEVSVLDMTYAYSVFASLGKLQGIALDPIRDDYRTRNPLVIRRIEAADGTVLWSYDPETVASSYDFIVESEFTYLVNHILSDERARRHTLSINDDILNIERPAAISNGMTGDMSDSWTIGYTPQLVVGVYLGRNDDARMSLDNYGLQGAAPVWQAVSRYAHDHYAYQPAIWSRPERLIDIPVCDISGLLVPDGSRCSQHLEIFHLQVQPQQEDRYWQAIEVNSLNGLRASATTRDVLIEERVYFVPPANVMEWWEANDQPLPPTVYDTTNALDAFTSAQIFLPQNLDYVSGEVDIRGSVNTNGLRSFQARYGEGYRPSAWFNIGTSQTEFIEGTSLGLWDTADLDGPYTLEILVVKTDGTTESSSITVTVDNVAPTIRLLTGDNAERLFRWPSQTVIPFEALVDDNYGVETVARVEFYQNGTYLGEVTDAPYEWYYDIERIGEETFTATVFDQAGNQASAEVTVEVIRQ